MVVVHDRVRGLPIVDSPCPALESAPPTDFGRPSIVYIGVIQSYVPGALFLVFVLG